MMWASAAPPEAKTAAWLIIASVPSQENYDHLHGGAHLDGPLKTDLRNVFYPRDPEWKKKVLTRGSELFENGMAILAAR